LTDHVKEDDMGRAFGMYERSEMHTWLWWGNLKENNHLENLGVGGRLLLK
jgi:hypothetical protein